MKWAFGIKQKMTVALILGFTFLLIFLKNRMDRSHIAELNTSFSSVYEDRLLVESYIFRLSELLHHKKTMMDNFSEQDAGQLSAQMKHQNAGIKDLLTDYQKTKLTPEEALSFNKLKQRIEQIAALEAGYLHHYETTQQLLPIRDSLHREFKLITQHLHQLSVIQLSEAKNLKEQSGKIVAGSDLLSELEFAILIFVALLIQILIFASRATRLSKPMPRHRLN